MFIYTRMCVHIYTCIYNLQANTYTNMGGAKKLFTDWVAFPPML